MKNRAISAPHRAALSIFVGVYEITPLLHLRVTQEDGVLSVQGTGQPKDSSRLFSSSVRTQGGAISMMRMPACRSR